MANKLEKKLSAIVCMGVVLENNMRKNSSASFAKLLDRFKLRLMLLRQVLPEYQQKEAAQIKRMVTNFGNQSFGTGNFHTSAFMSLIMAAIEDEMPKVTDGKKSDALESLHSIAKQMMRHYDRHITRYDDYETANNWMKRWQYV